MGSHPDSHLHAVATGPAKALVDAHQNEEPLKMYSGWFCPFVQRTWTTLEEKKIPYQYIEVNPYNKPKSLLDLNPRGLVPTLSVPTSAGQQPLYESTVLCQFLDETYPDHRPRLLPEDPYARARARVWMGFWESRFIPAFHRFLQWQPMSDGEGLRGAREAFLGKLKEFVREMDEEGPWFIAGEDISMVDLVAAPWMVRLWIFDHFKGGTGIPPPGAGGDDEVVWKRFRKWQGALEARPSIRNTTSEQEHYLPIYRRYADNTAQSELAKATREGKGVP